MSDKLLKHGGIIFSATIISFFFAYIFHFYMARALGPESYGILGSMLSLLYIFSVPSVVITTAVAHIVSEQNGVDGYGIIKSILLLSAKKLLLLGVLIFFILTILSSYLQNILHLPSKIPVILLGISLIFITVLPSPRGTLQGLQEFNSLGINIALEKPALLFFGALFVFLGKGVNGAILAYGAASSVIIILAFIPLKRILRYKSEKVDLPVLEYVFPIFILVLCVTVMASIDILFVRRYFPSDVTGYFTAMKMMGEVPYFLALALGGVLLPKVGELNAKNEKHGFLLRKALIYFSIVLVGIILAYSIAPGIIMAILFGDGYSSIAGYLVWYALTIGLLSLSIIIMYYDVSAKRTAFKYPLIFFTVLDAFLLMMFHKTIGMIIGIQAAIFIMLLVTVVITNRKCGDICGEN